MDDFNEINDFFDNDLFDDEPTIEEEEKKDDEQQLGAHFKTVDDKQKAADKKTKRKPQPKLDAALLIGPKGLPALRSAFTDVRFDPKGDPYQNLSRMMKKYEAWAHQMFPKMKFEDVVLQTEKLGHKRVVKRYLQSIRLNQPFDDEEALAAVGRKRKDVISTENNEEVVWTNERDQEADDQKDGDRESDEDAYYDPFATIVEKRKDKETAPLSEGKENTAGDDMENEGGRKNSEIPDDETWRAIMEDRNLEEQMNDFEAEMDGIEDDF